MARSRTKPGGSHVTGALTGAYRSVIFNLEKERSNRSEGVASRNRRYNLVE